MHERTITAAWAKTHHAAGALQDPVIWFHNHGEFSYFSVSIELKATAARLFICAPNYTYSRQEFDTMAEAFRTLREIGMTEGRFKDWTYRKPNPAPPTTPPDGDTPNDNKAAYPD